MRNPAEPANTWKSCVLVLWTIRPILVIWGMEQREREREEGKNSGLFHCHHSSLLSGPIHFFFLFNPRRGCHKRRRQSQHLTRETNRSNWDEHRLFTWRFWEEGIVQDPKQKKKKKKKMEEEEEKERKNRRFPSDTKKEKSSSKEEEGEEDGKGSWIIDKLPILFCLF